MAESQMKHARILEHFAGHAAVVAKLDALVPEIAAAGERMAAILGTGGSVWFAGNGGSAADAQHIAAEMEGRLVVERPARAVHTLGANSSTLTSVGNDYGFDEVFARQVRGFVRPSDLLCLISTSGNSPNLIAAAEAARAKGTFVVGLLGKGGGPLAPLCDATIIVPSGETQYVQEAHIMIGHVLCSIIDDRLTDGEDGRW